ncbi:MAG: type I glyceraldehyde-3-phosphate dehydrogenase [Gammaproteobacteria bacterium]|nr:type I glyceraldehyde-3-phosphate dehydrogenase [Gammaproteobacteria bacterium]
MTTIKIGINGFGRIGRMILRAAMQNFSDIEVVAINDLLDVEYLAYMLRYDSVHGCFPGDIQIDKQGIIVNGHKILVTQIKDPASLPWQAYGNVLVIDSTGFFLDAESASKHLQAGAHKVLMSAPSKDHTPMFVYGVNHDQYAGQKIVSNASCTTNCLAPLTKVIEDKWGIHRGLMSTIHAATATQKVVDAPSAKDWRGGRSVFGNIIPTSTGAAKAVGKVIPSLNGRLTGTSYRVPTANGSVIDLVAELTHPATYDEICAELKLQSETSLRGVLRYSQEDLVSTDIIGDAHTCIFDAKAGLSLDAHFVKLVAWYDNEWGYSNKCLEMARWMMSTDRG